MADGAPAAFSSPRSLARVAAQQYALPRVYFLLLLLRQCLYVDLGRVEAERRVFAVVGQVLSPFLSSQNHGLMYSILILSIVNFHHLHRELRLGECILRVEE